MRFPLDGLSLRPYLAHARQAPGPASAPSTDQDDSHQQQDDDDDDDDGDALSRYTCFGVVHHVGAMSAGHYVASVRVLPPGGGGGGGGGGSRWYCFNDAQVIIKAGCALRRWVVGRGGLGPKPST